MSARERAFQQRVATRCAPTSLFVAPCTRKLDYKGGDVLIALFAEIIADCGDPSILQALAQDCIDVARWMTGEASIDDKLAGSIPFCTMASVAVAGWQLQRQARDGAGGKRKVVVARYINEHLAAEARGQKPLTVASAGLLYALDAETLVEWFPRTRADTLRQSPIK